MKHNPEMIYFHDNPFHGLIKVKEPIKMQEKCPGSSYVIFTEAKPQFISCLLPTVNICDYIRPQLPGIHKKNVWHKLWISIFEWKKSEIWPINMNFWFLENAAFVYDQNFCGHTARPYTLTNKVWHICDIAFKIYDFFSFSNNLKFLIFSIRRISCQEPMKLLQKSENRPQKISKLKINTFSHPGYIFQISCIFIVCPHHERHSK